MIPDNYRKLYKSMGESAKGKRKNTVDANLSDITDNMFRDKAIQMYEAAINTKLFLHGADEIPTLLLDNDEPDDDCIAAIAVFPYIDALVLLGMKEKALKAYDCIKDTRLLKNRDDNLPIFAIGRDGSIYEDEFVSPSATTYINSLCSLGLKEEAMRHYETIKDMDIFTCRKDGLPIVSSEDIEDPDEAEIPFFTIATYIEMLCSLGLRKEAEKIYSTIEATGFAKIRNDGLPVNTELTTHAQYEKYLFSTDVFSYMLCLQSLGFHDKALKTYNAAARTPLMTNRPDGLLVESVDEHGNVYDSDLNAFTVFTCIKSLMGFHNSMPKDNAEKNRKTKLKKRKKRKK